jgi:hypothetical protein
MCQYVQDIALNVSGIESSIPDDLLSVWEIIYTLDGCTRALLEPITPVHK